MPLERRILPMHSVPTQRKLAPSKTVQPKATVHGRAGLPTSCLPPQQGWTLRELASPRLALLVFALFELAGTAGRAVLAEERELVSFRRIALTDVYYSEGANAGDIDRDGHVDAVYGPHWYAGPDFQKQHTIYPAKPQPREGYADHFFCWVHDFDGDQYPDVFAVGFPGTAAHVYRNPGPAGWDKPWPKHEVFDWVSNESPYFGELLGDKTPELVCTRDGFVGYATHDAGRGIDPWKFHPVSDRVTDARFGHGLGVGDVNGDDRADILMKDGWYEQPADLSVPRWVFHPFEFTAAGGAEMHAYDVDGDGDQDIITSLAAHEFGLAWFEQIEKDGQRTFRQHRIMGDRPSQNRYGLVFTELHSVNLRDMDGDGLKDIVTGKTYWSHHMQSPMWDAGAVVYWFRLERKGKEVDWVPVRADGEAGIGRQVTVTELNGDQWPDLVVGGMKGGHVLLQERRKATEAEWQAARPREYDGPPEPEQESDNLPLDEQTGRVPGAIEGESLRVLKVSRGEAVPQEMGGFTQGRWSGRRQLFWTGAQPDDTLQLEFTVEKPGKYELQAAFTKARDYGIARIHLNDQPLLQELDLFHGTGVVTTGLLSLGQAQLEAGTQRLTIQITGSNPAAIKAYMFGIDFLLLRAVP